MSTVTIPQALEMALAQYRAGRMAEAEALYRQILNVQSDNVEALHLLGVIASQTSRPLDAAVLIRRALQFQPDLPEAHLNLGNALLAANRPEEAVIAFRRALQLQPGFAEAHNSLGATLKQQGNLDEAVIAYREATRFRPDYFQAHNNLGVALSEQGHLAEAIVAFQHALRIRPNLPDAHYGIANALRNQGRPDEAIAAFRRAIELNPGDAWANNNLGALLEARGRLGEAEETFRHGIAANPDFAPLHNNLGNLLKDEGRLDEALACYRRGTETPPSTAVFDDNLLAVLHYCTGTTLSGLFDAHCEFDRRHALPLLANSKPHAHPQDPDRPLRLGLVSPHFAFHPVGHFLIRVLENLGRSEFEIVGYSDTRVEDPMTARLRATMTDWRPVSRLTDEQLTERIQADRIDILVDLAGHTAGNRLLVFARKPAPIQITWLDYVGTTGLSAMDYILADPQQIPPEAEPWYREKVLRMPDDYICYDPPADAPPVGPLPALTNGRVTFASFNIPPKTTPESIRTWARILRALPAARMTLKNRGFDDPSTCARYRELFFAEGITGDRVTLLGWSPSHELLACYNQVDIALDTLPYNGGLTTCEALWMGVPVVTCPGEIFASRHGLTHLSAAGITETIAGSIDQYVELAVALATDLPRLATLREGMRQRVAASPLCDGKRFAPHFTALLRDVWQQWCRKSAPPD